MWFSTFRNNNGSFIKLNSQFFHTTSHLSDIVLFFQGTVIQGTMTVDDSHVILPNMHEGNVYEFYLFRVIPAKKKYGIVSHKWQVRFNRAVIIKPASDRYPEIPLRYFNFCRFEELGKQIGENAIVGSFIFISFLFYISSKVWFSS